MTKIEIYEMTKIEIYESDSEHVSQRWWWRLRAHNGRIIAGSTEGYTSQDAARRMAQSLFFGVPIILKTKDDQ